MQTYIKRRSFLAATVGIAGTSTITAKETEISDPENLIGVSVEYEILREKQGEQTNFAKATVDVVDHDDSVLIADTTFDENHGPRIERQAQFPLESVIIRPPKTSHTDATKGYYVEDIESGEMKTIWKNGYITSFSAKVKNDQIIKHSIDLVYSEGHPTGFSPLLFFLSGLIPLSINQDIK